MITGTHTTLARTDPQLSTTDARCIALLSGGKVLVTQSHDHHDRHPSSNSLSNLARQPPSQRAAAMSGGMVHAALASPEAFAVLVGQTLSTDNKLRCGAEELYRELQKARPDACVTNLLQLLRASHAAEVRSTCAIFLRKVRWRWRRAWGADAGGWVRMLKRTHTAVRAQRRRSSWATAGNGWPPKKTCPSL